MVDEAEDHTDDVDATAPLLLPLPLHAAEVRDVTDNAEESTELSLKSK